MVAYIKESTVQLVRVLFKLYLLQSHRWLEVEDGVSYFMQIIHVLLFNVVCAYKVSNRQSINVYHIWILGETGDGQAELLSCDRCSKVYKHSSSLFRHKRYMCGKEPSFFCMVSGCSYKTKRKDHLNNHYGGFHQMFKMSLSSDLKVPVKWLTDF